MSDNIKKQMDRKIIDKLREDLNIELQEYIYTTYGEKKYIEEMINFLGKYLDIRKISWLKDIEELSPYLSSIYDMENFMKFYHEEYDEKNDDGFVGVVEDYSYFIRICNFKQWMENIIRIMDYDETILFNKFCMELLYGKHKL